MKFKNIFLVFVFLIIVMLFVYVVIELILEQVVVLKFYDCVVVIGWFNVIGDVVQVVLCKVDKDGVVLFYVVDMLDYGNGGNWCVMVDFYKEDVLKVDVLKNCIINGVMELLKDQVVELMFYDIVIVQGFYCSQLEVNDVIIKVVKVKGVYVFFIVCQVDVNQGGNQCIIVYIYKKDVEKCVLQSLDVILVDFEVGCVVLVKGGEVVKNVEILGVVIIVVVGLGIGVGCFFEIQFLKGGCYIVILLNGIKVEEVNKVIVV